MSVISLLLLFSGLMLYNQVLKQFLHSLTVMHAGISTVMRKLYVAMCRVSCFLPVMQKTENIQPVPFLK